MARGRRPGSGVSRAPAGEGAGTGGRRSPIDMSPKAVARREKRKLYMRQYRARRRLVDEPASPVQPAAAVTDPEAHHPVQPLHLIRGLQACPVAGSGWNMIELALSKDTSSDEGPSMLEYSSMWELLPQDVMDKILGLLPASSQARLRCVCKHWSDLVISSAFRDESNLLAFQRGKRNFRCYLYTLDRSEAGNDGEGAGLPILRHPKLFSGVRAGLVGVVETIEESLCCWLVNMANKTSCALPPLPFRESDSTTSDWECRECKIWLEPTPESASSSTTQISGFQLFVMVVRGHPVDIARSSCTLYRYSSISTGWATLHCQLLGIHSSWNARWICVPTKGGFLGYDSHGIENRKLARMSWDSGCITHLPDVPNPLRDPQVPVHVISDPGSGAVFVYQVDYDSLFLVLHRLDESSTTPRWTCVYSGPPPEFHHLHREHVGVTKVTFLANMLVIVFHSGGCSYGSYGLAYHMQDGSCQWFRLPDAQAFSYAPSDRSVLLDPMVVSQLRL